MPTKRGLLIRPNDNVANLLEEALPGEGVVFQSEAGSSTLVASERIPFGFKMAVKRIPEGAPIVKYGETIGRAARSIEAGGARPRPQPGRREGARRP
jgi:altronate dehydratase small subunit